VRNVARPLARGYESKLFPVSSSCLALPAAAAKNWTRWEFERYAVRNSAGEATEHQTPVYPSLSVSLRSYHSVPRVVSCDSCPLALVVCGLTNRLQLRPVR